MSGELGLVRRSRSPWTGSVAWFSPRLILGLAIVVLGSLLLLDNLNLIEADPLYRYFFPGVLLAVGLSVLVQGSIWGWVWIVGGRSGCWPRSSSSSRSTSSSSSCRRCSSWSAARSSTAPSCDRRTTAPGPEDPASYVRAFAVMSGNERRGIASTFRGGDLAAFMGGVTLDLRQAKMTPEGAVVDTFAFWGGIEVKVPETWQVRGEVIPLMGGFEDKTRPKAGVVEGHAGHSRLRHHGRGRSVELRARSCTR